MKKLFISLLAIAATVNAMAALSYEAKATLKLQSTTSQTCEVTLAQMAGSVSKYCAEMNMSGRKVALYVMDNSKNYEIFAANDLDGAALGVLTDEATEYTITFSDVIGKLYLVDGEKYIEIVEGGSYTFKAEANQTIADRFSISKYPPYLFVDGMLTIGELKDGTVINMQYFTYVDGKRVNGHAGTSSNKSVELFTTEGYCEISYTNKAGVARKFIVNPAPVVTPAN